MFLPLKIINCCRVGSRGRDEGDYWEAPPAPESVASSQPLTLSVVGDFVDEDGNPCSNV